MVVACALTAHGPAIADSGVGAGVLPTGTAKGGVGGLGAAISRTPERNTKPAKDSRKTKGTTKPDSVGKRLTEKGQRVKTGFVSKGCVDRPSDLRNAGDKIVGTDWSCINGRLYKTDCTISICFTKDVNTPPTPGAATPDNTTPPVVIPQPNIPALIKSAIEQIPPPLPIMSPPFEQRPSIEGVAGIPIYFAVDTDQWKPVSASATDGIYHLTVTAKPTTLTFDTGYGDDVRTCDGPGLRITEYNWERRKDTECKYTYQESSRENKDYASTLTITWTTSVITNIKPASRVTTLVEQEITTTTNIPIPIVEIQAILQ
jgi:hypothetical protein